jgi:NH3-dependent NAD+ synthetase
MRLECFSEKEIRMIMGYEDEDFLPSYRFHDICLWERSRVESYVAKQHPNWKKSEIEEYLKSKIRALQACNQPNIN